MCLIRVKRPRDAHMRFLNVFLKWVYVIILSNMQKSHVILILTNEGCPGKNCHSQIDPNVVPIMKRYKQLLPSMASQLGNELRESFYLIH